MPSPVHPDQDANGFRNPLVPETASIVALGDSNTYGWGVKPDEAWPRQLERVSGQRVYSLAWGGFGPVHLLALFDRALAFKPKLIILSFYAGNDLYDSYSLVYKDARFPSSNPSNDGSREDPELRLSFRQDSAVSTNRPSIRLKWH